MFTCMYMCVHVLTTMNPYCGKHRLNPLKQVCEHVCACLCWLEGWLWGRRQTINNRKRIRSATQADQRMPEFLDEGDIWPLDPRCFVISPQRLWEIHFIHRASKQGIVFILLSVRVTVLRLVAQMNGVWLAAGSWKCICEALTIISRVWSWKTSQQTALRAQREWL